MGFTLREASKRLRKMRVGKSVVLAGGTFDILHPGHLKYLDRCRAQGDILIVCVSGDARTRKRKGVHRPVMPAIQRAEIVASLKLVDLVFVSNLKPFSDSILQSIRPNVLVTSSNEPSKAVKEQFRQQMRRKHPEIKVILVSRSDWAASSSSLVSRLSLGL